MKARANKSEINKKLSTLKQHHRARGLQEVEISQISEVIILELQTTLIEYEVTYTETITEIYIEESIEVTSEETTTISEIYNSKVANEKKKINQTKISLQNTHDSIKQTKREISKAKKMLKDTKNKIVSTNEKLKIDMKIDKLQSKLPVLHKKAHNQTNKITLHIKGKAKDIKNKHISDGKNAKKTIKAADNKKKLLDNNLSIKKDKLAAAHKANDIAMIGVLTRQVNEVEVEITTIVQVITVQTEVIEESITLESSIEYEEITEIQTTTSQTQSLYCSKVYIVALLPSFN